MANTLTLGQYKLFTRTKLNRTSYDGIKLTQFADEALKEICNNRIWRFMEEKFEGTISTSFNEYDFPDPHMQSLINFTVVGPDGSQFFPDYMPYQLFDQKYPNPSVLTPAPPTVWTSFGPALIVGPAFPDKVYTMRLRFVKAPVNLIGAADTVTIDLPDDFSEIMTLGMYRRALEASDNFNQAQVVYQEWLDQMDAMSERLQSRQFGVPLRMGGAATRTARMGSR